MANKKTKQETEIQVSAEQELDIKELSTVMAEENSLTPFEQLFIFHYSTNPNGVEALKKTRKDLGLPVKTAPFEVLEAEAHSMLIKNNIKKALSKFRGAIASKTELTMINTGTKLSEAFSSLTTDQSNLERIKSRIEKYDEMMEKAELAGDINLWIQLDERQRGLFKQHDKAEELLRKNLALVHDMTGASKTKQVIRAGALNINMGNGTINSGGETAKHLDVIEGNVYNNDLDELPDLDEME